MSERSSCGATTDDVTSQPLVDPDQLRLLFFRSAISDIPWLEQQPWPSLGADSAKLNLMDVDSTNTKTPVRKNTALNTRPRNEKRLVAPSVHAVSR